MSTNLETITLGGGCFWCVEAVFQRVQGVQKSISGYAGGKTKNPSYQEICTGNSGHAEVIQITFDCQIISLKEILEIFWQTHDPTTLNQQGADRGTQYRSVVFFHNQEQEKIALKSMEETEKSNLWPNKIVTEITSLPVFYEGEAYHQNYFRDNPSQPYCLAVIHPKLNKLKSLLG